MSNCWLRELQSYSGRGYSILTSGFVAVLGAFISQRCVLVSVSVPGARYSKARNLFGLEKPFVKLRPAYSAKLVFSFVVKGIKIKITAKFRAFRRLTFEDTKRILSLEMHPKSFGTFEKQAPGDICGFAHPFPWTFLYPGIPFFPFLNHQDFPFTIQFIVRILRFFF